MLWTLVDLAIYLLGVLVLALGAFALYKRVRLFMKAAGAASSRVADASVELNAQQAQTARRSRTDVR